MSQSGRSERMGFLRAHVARLEASGTRHAGRPAAGTRVPLGAGRLDQALGGGLAPAGLHEIAAGAPAEAGAATGFTLALAIRCAASRAGAVLWIGEAAACGEAGLPYAPGLRLHGLDPGRLVFIRARTAPNALWAIEEALKSRACAAVVGELFSLKDYDLTASRRLVLAAQAGGTPALLLATGLAGHIGQLSTGAATRFEVFAAPSVENPATARRLPLPGRPAWGVRLAKARAGAAGLDTDRLNPIVWDFTEGFFRDALPRPLAAEPADRPDPAPATLHHLAANLPRRARRA